jgi:hypothetical protein
MRIEVDTIKIKYIFSWSNQREDIYDLVLDANTLNIISPYPVEAPLWTALDFYQCPNCTLDIKSSPHCPLALELVAMNTQFSNLVSYEKVHVEVVTDERTILKDTTAQKAISSLMGLIIPCSGCPHTRFLKPMARFHLPLATEQETIYRASSMYLLAQYFLKKSGKEADLDLCGLNDIYENLQEINIYCAKRLSNASPSDSTINSVVLLDMFAKTVLYGIKESLEELQYLFQPFLSESNPSLNSDAQ